MSDADRLDEIEKKLQLMRTEQLTTAKDVCELKLYFKRIEEKLDVIVLKLMAPNLLAEVHEDWAGTLKVDAPDDITDKLNEFLQGQGKRPISDGSAGI